MFRSWYATCPRGSEQALEGELAALGAKGIRTSPGLVRFTGPRELALRACLELRCALRVLEPIGEFHCETAEELYAGTRGLPWAELLAPGQTLAVCATGKAPGLIHTHFVALKIKDAICDLLRDTRGSRPDVDVQRPDVLVVAYLGNGKCSISLDLAGELLSNRGYRLATVEAPLRESLAAAMVRYSGWDLVRPLHDPVCGSGTLAIEAALLALGRAPGIDRQLSCARWPRYGVEDRELLARLRQEMYARAEARQRAGVPEILASDRDSAAVQAAQDNVRAAGLSSVVRVFQADAREVAPLVPAGQLLLNVPYGERLDAGGRKQLKSFYHLLGAAIRRLAGHRAAVLSASEDFESAFGIRPRGPRRELWNGPLRCRLYTYEL